MNSANNLAKYRKILNNLLDIKGRDKVIFTKVDNSSTFDVTTKFSQKISEKILLQKSFAMNIDEVDLEQLIEEIRDEDNFENIINAFTKRNEKLSNVKKLALENSKTFEETKKEIIESLEVDIQKQQTRWKSFIRKAMDENIQENVWPLHVATLFISVKTDDKVVYAPLLLKEVMLNYVNGKLNLDDTSDWKINEKVLFVLNSAGFSLKEEFNFDEKSFADILSEIRSEYKLADDIDFTSPFVNLKSEEINNTKITLHPGVVLGLFQPSGGHLRETMIKIIKNDELDSIIDPEIDKTKYETRIDNFINSSKNLLRIQKTNFSQDRALISAMSQDTIIWGPPGTGKSQVIANIIANILAYDKSAVVMSQKKAALDVLKKRMGKLAKFALFILNDNKMDKNEFYKPLQEFINAVEYSKTQSNFQSTPIISELEKTQLDFIRELKNKNEYDDYLKLLDFVSKTSVDSIMLAFDQLNLIDKSLSIPKVENRFLLPETLAIANNIKKKKFIVSWYPKNIKETSDAVAQIGMLLKELDINRFIDYASKVDKVKFNTFMNIPKNIIQTNAQVNAETFIEEKIAIFIKNKISNWQATDKEMYKAYKSFANAVMAGRSIPYKFMGKHADVIRQLFKVIVTTPQTTFVKWEKQSVDYAILDESSQIFVEVGVPVLYLAKIHILAGDPMQMKPSRWFSTRDENSDEEELPEDAESLLDYGREKRMFEVMLNKNYRSSYSSLMSFSAKEFYESDLDVVDNATSSENPIEVINVNGTWEKSTNLKEAKKVILLALENLSKYEKIIILTFNIAQKQLIEDIILTSSPELSEALSNEKLSLRNIENIQGDEADLVIASVVYDPTTPMGMTYVSRPGGKNALNVAISRAKDKMIVVKSVTFSTIKSANSEDFITFKKWLEFLDMPEKEKKIYSVSNEIEYKASKTIGDTESGFEYDVVNLLKRELSLSRQFEIVSQYEVGSKRIDIALVDKELNKFILGIEVDGYAYHNGQGYQKYLEDKSRQEFLEAKGYDIFRIKEIDWHLHRDKLITDIKNISETKIKKILLREKLNKPIGI